MFEKKIIAVGKVTNGQVEIQTTTPVETVPQAWEQARIEAEKQSGTKLVKFFNGGSK